MARLCPVLNEKIRHPQIEKFFHAEYPEQNHNVAIYKYVFGRCQIIRSARRRAVTPEHHTTDSAVGGSANAVADWVQQKTGVDTRSFGPAIAEWLGFDNQQAGTAAYQYSLAGNSLRDGVMSLGSNAPAYTLNPIFNLTVAPSVPLTIQSDIGRLADYIDFNAKASAASFEQSLTLAISSGQSSTGG